MKNNGERITPNHSRKSLFSRYRSKVDEEMESFVRANAGLASPMVMYHLGFSNENGTVVGKRSVGKSFRSTLALLTIEALGGDWKKAIPIAVALELFHNFTLVHDDIQDNDPERRGRSTVWRLWGKEQAINVGDAMAYVSSLALFDLLNNGYSPDVTVQIAQRLFETGIKVINGQYLDLVFEHSRKVSIDSYLEMVGNKTGALIEASVMMCADLVGADKKTKEHLEKYAKNIGIAFQISDDILGIWGDERETGKRNCSDIYEKKQSLPILLAFKKQRERHEKELLSIYNRQQAELDDSDVKKVLLILNNLGIKKLAELELSRVHDLAVREIKLLSLGWATNDFLLIADLVANRKY